MKTADILTIIQETIDNITGIKAPETLKPWTMTQVKSKVKGLVGKFEDQLQHKHTYPSEFMQGLHRGEHDAAITDAIVDEINSCQCEDERMAFVAGLAQARGMVAEAMNPWDRLRGKFLDFHLDVQWADSESIGNAFLKNALKNPSSFISDVKDVMRKPFYKEQLASQKQLIQSVFERESQEPSRRWSKTLRTLSGMTPEVFVVAGAIIDAYYATLAKETPPQSRTWDQRKTYGGSTNSRGLAPNPAKVVEDNGNLFDGPPTVAPSVPTLPTKARPLYTIAREIRKTWPNVNYAAKPYLDAMGSLEKLSDMYMHDDARSIVLYFLSNATTWKGPDAKRIKAELKAMLAGKLKEAVTGCAMCNEEDTLEEAIYKGENVVLNQPKRTPNGPNKFVVYTKNDQGHVVKISFGSKKDYNCEKKAAKWTPRYWACKWAWGEKLLDRERAKDVEKGKKEIVPSKVKSDDK